ncbi:MAG: glycosyltransferase family 9 protein [Pseudomonadota bacterium]
MQGPASLGAKRILFVTSTRIGDAVLSSGVLRRLIADHPRARLTVACGPAAAPLFEATPNLERIIVLDKMPFSLHWLELWARCAGSVWDLVVDLRNTPLTWLLAARGQRRIKSGRAAIHRVQLYGRVLDLGLDPPAPGLWTLPRHEDEARRLLPDGHPVLAVGPSANWRAKTWPAERFLELIGRLTGPSGILPGAKVAVFGRDDERPSALGLIEAIPPERRIDLMGKVELLTAYACFKRAALYVGNDSGLMHMAAAAGAPTLGLFGPSREELYAPWGPRAGVARAGLGFDRIFPPNFDHRTTGTLMESLSVDAVEAAAWELWRRAGTKAA